MSEPLAPPELLFPSTEPPVAPYTAPVRPPETLLIDCAISLIVVAVCAWKRGHILELGDSSLMAVALFFPLGNLLGGALSLGAYKLRVTALYYRMALGAVFTLYYGYVALHLAGLHDSQLGTLVVTTAGDTLTAKIETGVALALLLLQTFIATDACQRTLIALQPPLVAVPVESAPPPKIRAVDAVTVIPS